MFVACTRVTDYWHHYEDVILGSLIGIAAAFAAYTIIGPELEYGNILKNEVGLADISGKNKYHSTAGDSGVGTTGNVDI